MSVWEGRPMMPLYADWMSMTWKSTIAVVVVGHSPRVKGSVINPVIGTSWPESPTSLPEHGFKQLGLSPSSWKHLSTICRTSSIVNEHTSYLCPSNVFFNYDCIRVLKVNTFHVFIGESDWTGNLGSRKSILITFTDHTFLFLPAWEVPHAAGPPAIVCTTLAGASHLSDCGWKFSCCSIFLFLSPSSRHELFATNASNSLNWLGTHLLLMVVAIVYIMSIIAMVLALEVLVFTCWKLHLDRDRWLYVVTFLLHVVEDFRSRTVQQSVAL